MAYLSLDDSARHSAVVNRSEGRSRAKGEGENDSTELHRGYVCTCGAHRVDGSRQTKVVVDILPRGAARVTGVNARSNRSFGDRKTKVPQSAADAIIQWGRGGGVGV